MGVVILATTGTAGDVVQFLEVGRALVTRGHSVTLISHAVYEERAHAAEMAFEPLDTEEEYARLLDATATLLDHGYDVDYVRAATAWYDSLERVERQQQAVRNAIDGAGVSVAVGRFLSASPVLVAAEAAGAPTLWAVLWPAMLTDLALDPIPERSHAERFARERELVGLATIGWRAWLEAIPALGLWPDWFGALPRVLPSLQLTGFVPADSFETGPLSPELKRFLGDGAPPVLVTAGSGRMVRPEIYEVAIAGCAQAGLRSLVISRHREHVPADLPPGCLWARAAPFGTLARHVAAAVHHGGISTCARMLAAGVPQLVLPDGVDRPDNGRRIDELGVGQCLPRPFWSPANVAAALSELTGWPAATAAQLAERVAEDDGLGRACAAIEARLDGALAARPPAV